MIIVRNKYWSEIANEQYYNPKEFYMDKKEIEGFWELFLYENILVANKEIENKVKTLVANKSFKAAKLELPYFDRLIVYTSCDKSEIEKIREIILKT